MKNLFVNLALIAISIFCAWFFVNAFDAWYVDKEARRAEKRAKQDHPSSSGPRYE